MKTINKIAGLVFGLFVLSVLLTSCSSGVQKDLGTGLKMSYTGLSVEDSYLKVNEGKFNSNKIPIGKEVVIILEDITGLQMKDGVYTILFETTVTDPDGNYLLQYNDTLVEPEIRVLKSYLTVAEPMVPGKKYKWISTFTDLNGKGMVEATIDIEVIE